MKRSTLFFLIFLSLAGSLNAQSFFNATSDSAVFVGDNFQNTDTTAVFLFMNTIRVKQIKSRGITGIMTISVSDTFEIDKLKFDATGIVVDSANVLVDTLRFWVGSQEYNAFKPGAAPGAAGGETNTYSTLGGGTFTVVGTKAGSDLPHRELIGGTNVILSQTSTAVTINATAGAGDSSFVTLDLDTLNNFNNAATTNIVVTDTLELNSLTASRLLVLDSNKLTVNTVTGANLNLSISDENAVFESRTLTAGAGLTGGGDLSANRTFDVVSSTDDIVVNANDFTFTPANVNITEFAGISTIDDILGGNGITVTAGVNTILDGDATIAISLNSVNEDELSAVISLDDADLFDLSAILHNDAAAQGLRLPNVGASPTDITGTTEGYIAYDEAGNRVLVNTGAAWDLIISGSNTGDVTLAGTPDYATISAQVITLNQLDIADDLAAFTSDQFSGRVSNESGTGLVILQTNATIITPTISGTGWTNATHAHLAANSGGQITKASISDLTIDNTELANMAQNTIKMRVASGTGDPEDIDISAGLTLVTGVSGDFVIIEDATDGNLKRVDVSDFLGGGVTWDAIGDAASPADILFAELVQTLTWNTAAASAAFEGLAIRMTHDATSGSNTQSLFIVERLAAGAGSEALENLVIIRNADDQVVDIGILVVGTSTGAITTAIDASDAEIGVVLRTGANDVITTAGGTVTQAEFDILQDGTISYSEMTFADNIVNSDIATDAINLNEMDDGADTPLVNEFLRVATGATDIRYDTEQQVADDLEDNIDHNNLLNFVANEHINHTSVTFTAGTNLNGGGDLSANRTFNLDDPITLNRANYDTLGIETANVNLIVLARGAGDIVLEDSVGIGTTSPGSILEIQTSANGATELFFITVDPATPANNDEAQIAFRLDPSGGGAVRTFGRVDVALLDITDGAETAAWGADVWDSDGAGTMIEGINIIGRTGQDEVIINNAQVDLDFRVHGDTNTDILIVNAGTEITSIRELTVTTGALTSNANLIMGNDALIQRDVNAGITASTTQTQGNGALTAEINEISTVANENDTNTLPTAVAGLKVIIINNGANILRLFPASGDDLGAGLNTAINVKVGEIVSFVAYDATNWRAQDDIGMLEVQFSAFDTTATNGSLIFEQVSKSKRWVFAASTIDTLQLYETVNLPEFFDSWIEWLFTYTAESTGADSISVLTSPTAHDEADDDTNLSYSARDTLISPTGPAANDARLSSALLSFNGTYAADDKVYMAIVRNAGDAGIINMTGSLKMYYKRRR